MPANTGEHQRKDAAMDGQLSTWWMVLSALMIVLMLPDGGRRPRSSRK
jgi:hypothetical protein